MAYNCSRCVRVSFILGYFINSTETFYCSRTKKQRIRWLVSRECKHSAFGNPNDASAAFATSALIYRSLQYAYRAFMWLGLGLVFQYFYELGVVIGGLGFIYYIFKAYEEVAPFKEGENTPEARKEKIHLKQGKM